MQAMKSDPAASFSYYGEHEGWLVAYSKHRDSDVLDRSNFQAITTRLAAEVGPEGDDWVIEGFSHFVIGHGEWILIRPGTRAQEVAEDCRKAMENYPVLDDDLYSEMETEEAIQTAEVALRDNGYPLEECKAAAPFVYDQTEDAGGHDSVGHRGIEDYWPSKDSCFWGFLHYRRSLKVRQ